jgi:hypothetical protein
MDNAYPVVDRELQQLSICMSVSDHAFGLAFIVSTGVAAGFSWHQQEAIALMQRKL